MSNTSGRSNIVAESQSDEIDLRDLVVSLWNGRGLIIGAVLIALLGAFSYVIVDYLRKQDTHVIQGYISLTSIVDGRYPNGTNFSVEDLTSSEVLSEVRTSAGLVDFDVTDLASSVRVSFGHPGSAAVRSEWERAVEDALAADLGADEIAVINTAYSERLTQLNSRSVSITVDPVPLNLSDAAAQNLAMTVPMVWQRIYIEDYKIALPPSMLTVNALDVPGSLASTRELLQAQQFLFVAKRLMEIAGEESRLATLRAGRGLNAAEVAYNIDQFTTFYLNPMLGSLLRVEDPTAQMRLRDLELERNRLLTLRRSNASSIEQISAIQGGNLGASRPAGQSGEAGSTVLSLDNTGIASVVDLAQQAQLNQYLISLFDRDWELSSDLADIDLQIAQLTPRNAVNGGDVVEIANLEFATLSSDITSLLTLWMSEELRSTQTLYSVQVPAQVYQPTSIVNPKYSLLVALSLVLGGFVGIVAALMRNVVRKQNDRLANA
jgi:hypothetical protein